MRFSVGFLLALSTLNGSAATLPAPEVCDVFTAESPVEFIATGSPSALKVYGKNAQVKGQLSSVISAQKQNWSGTLQVELDQFDTGLKTRNEHMKNKYLEVAKYPLASLEITSFTSALGADSDQKSPFQGKLSFHGVEKPITGLAEVHRVGSNAEIIANFEMNLTDYGVAVPSFAGITIANAVNVSAKMVCGAK